MQCQPARHAAAPRSTCQCAVSDTTVDGRVVAQGMETERLWQSRHVQEPPPLSKTTRGSSCVSVPEQDHQRSWLVCLDHETSGLISVTSKCCLLRLSCRQRWQAVQQQVPGGVSAGCDCNQRAAKRKPQLSRQQRPPSAERHCRQPAWTCLPLPQDLQTCVW
jgi:hypothetical protein